uniref:interleukin-21 receptor isoform X1 n=1 Tax=Gasterosteus aculeatus aculeatus TaxID=481459 RepID=UPI001A9A20A0|nr:interleukin-21 receptor isoform X1 [Gasterosteus aculeatus aculeatus]
MDPRRAPGLRTLLPVLLLASAGAGGDPPAVVYRNLQCVNDYLFTINCSLSIVQPDGRSRYWLTFTETHDGTTFACPLTNTGEEFCCSIKTHNPTPDEDEEDAEDEATFQDLNRYAVSLCHRRPEGSDACERLGDKFNPALNIKPNAPRGLAVRRNASRHLFTWTSTYEPYDDVTGLVQALEYQLRYHERGHARDALPHTLRTNLLNLSVDDDNFVPNTKYAARVRSSPDQAFFKGHWSDWSSEVYWDTPPAVTELPSNTLVSGLVKVLVPLCVVASLVLLFCYAPVKKWRKGAFIPTPALYFLTPNSDCQGDFKSWAVTEENTADMLKAEEILQIDTFTECGVPEEEEEEESQAQFHHQFTEGSAYNNVSLLGVPYAVSSMAPPPPPLPPGGHAEGDSGCWLEKYCPMYCNEYCTLSAFQKGPTGAAEDRGPPTTKACPTGALRAEAGTEALADQLGTSQ